MGAIDGRGRALDNIFVKRLWRSLKHEDIYLKGYESPRELVRGLSEYFAWDTTAGAPTRAWATVPPMPCTARARAVGRAS